MPGFIRSVPGGVASIYDKFQATVHDAYADKTYLSSNRYQYDGRGLRGLGGWSYDGGRWPNRSGFYTDPAGPTNVDLFQNRASQAGSFEPPLTGVGGNATQNFIMGRCKDSVGNGVSGAVVQTFRTADDTLISETNADSNGYYEAGTPQPAGTQHYIVAYRAGAPDIAGTTVNTLTATKRDGTAP